LDLSLVLPLLIRVDTGIERLDFSGNVLSKPLNTKTLKSFQSVVNLSLSRCAFSAGSLQSVFKCFNGPTQIRADLSHIVLEPSDWAAFYAELPALEVSSLSGLIWDGNTINESNSDPFFQFIQQHGKLCEISLCGALDGGALPFLAKMSGLTQLTSVSLACDRKFSLGKAMADILLALVRNNAIQALDVSGHEIGDDGLLELLRAAPALRELRFHEFGVSGGEGLVAVCEEVLASPSITFAAFPTPDVKPALAKSHIAKRPEIARALSQLRVKFVEKFGKCAALADDGEILARFVTQIPSWMKGGDGATSRTNALARTTIRQSMPVMKFFTNYDRDTLAYIEECGDVTGTDPMSKVYNAATEALEIARLVQIFE
jgi:hypothetical protein